MKIDSLDTVNEIVSIADEYIRLRHDASDLEM